MHSALGWAVLAAHAAGAASAFCSIGVGLGGGGRLTTPPAASRLLAAPLAPPGARTLRLSGGAAMGMGAVDSPEAVRALAEEMKTAASGQEPFTDAELDKAVAAVQELAGEGSGIDWGALRRLMAEVAHVSHKDWPKTGAGGRGRGRGCACCS